MGDVKLDGQSVDFWHTKEGEAARLKSIKMAEDINACWPPCGEEHCAPVRDFMRSAEYTGGHPRDGG